MYVGLEHVYDTFSDGKINNENDVFRIAITAVLWTNYLELEFICPQTGLRVKS